MRLLLLLLENKSACGLIANLARTPVLDRTRIDVASVLSPLVAMSSEGLEGFAVKFNKGLADNGLHLAITTFHVHHHSDGHTASLPLVSTSSSVLHDSHVASLAVGNELSSAGTESIAVVGIEVRRSCAASLVAEEVVQSLERAIILALSLPLSELVAYHL